MVRVLGAFVLSVLLAIPIARAQTPGPYQLPDGTAPSGLAVDAAGAVWFVSRPNGALGRLDPGTGETSLFALGHGAQPSTLTLGPDGGLFATDAVANLVYRVDPTTREVVRFPIEGPSGPLELNSAAFDHRERLWFAGYSGHFGFLDLRSGQAAVLPAPGGRGPAALTSDGSQVWFASYTTNAVVRVDPETLRAEVFALPSDQEGPKSLVIGREGELWVTAHQSRALLRFDPKASAWNAWTIPAAEARPGAVALDPQGAPVLSDVGHSALRTFDAASGTFAEFALGSGCMARAILPSPAGIWVAETRCDSLRWVPADALAGAAVR
jgi:virginiamycin B lyase